MRQIKTKEKGIFLYLSITKVYTGAFNAMKSWHSALGKTIRKDYDTMLYDGRLKENSDEKTTCVTKDHVAKKQDRMQ